MMETKSMDQDQLLHGLNVKLDDRTARVAVIGQGYVGLPLAMRAAEVGYDVVGLDTATDRVDALTAGRSYVEDISDDRLADVERQGPGVDRKRGDGRDPCGSGDSRRAHA